MTLSGRATAIICIMACANLAWRALLNGVALHGGFIPFGGTFLVFSDYSRNALRLAALMRQRVIHVLTHDSIGVGEDGPTHQPIEHVTSLRLIPHMDVWRPCDTLETAVAWRAAVERADGPSCLILTRQNLVQHRGDVSRAALAARGGYVLRDAPGTLDLVVIATGSEVGLAVEAADILAHRGIGGARSFHAVDDGVRQAGCGVSAERFAGWCAPRGGRGGCE